MNRTFVALLATAALPACGLFDDKKDKNGAHVPGKAVPFDQLSALLPKRQGWDGTKASGKMSDVGGGDVTVASSTYEKKVGDQVQKVQLELLDGNYVSSAYAPLAIMSHGNAGKPDPHKRAIKINGHSGIEQWDPKTHDVLARVMVARRFMVSLKGSNITPAIVEEWLKSIDMNKMASWTKKD